MTDKKELDISTLFQPSLLTKDDLIEKIKQRNCRVQNLSTMSKERLVGIFRQLILPLPQRTYRSNRRGKMLMTRRAKASLEGGKKRENSEAGENEKRRPSKVSHSEDRLKPPPDYFKSRFLIDSSYNKSSSSSSSSLKNIVINDRRKGGGLYGSQEGRSSNPGRRISLKRSSYDSEKFRESASASDRKKQRTTIKWP